jgi:hypothetical protein
MPGMKVAEATAASQREIAIRCKIRTLDPAS